MSQPYDPIQEACIHLTAGSQSCHTLSSAYTVVHYTDDILMLYLSVVLVSWEAAAEQDIWFNITLEEVVLHDLQCSIILSQEQEIAVLSKVSGI